MAIGPISAEIRFVMGDDFEGLYINGTKVIEDEIVDGSEIMRILRDNLNFDTKTLFVDDDKIVDDDLEEYPTKLIDLQKYVLREE